MNKSVYVAVEEELQRLNKVVGSQFNSNEGVNLLEVRELYTKCIDNLITGVKFCYDVLEIIDFYETIGIIEMITEVKRKEWML